MKKIIIYYSFLLVSFITMVGFWDAKDFSQLLAALVFYPICFYFTILVFPSRKKTIITTLPKPKIQEAIPLKAEVPLPKNVDRDRRAFIKLIGSAGMMVFLFSIFTKKAEGAFFGSVPGPGTVSLKNTAGVQIDPAERSPIDGYVLTELDDGLTSYYGYVDKNSNWYILREDALGHYRYAKGAEQFSTNWDNRANELLITYDTFDNVFSPG